MDKMCRESILELNALILEEKEIANETKLLFNCLGFKTNAEHEQCSKDCKNCSKDFKSIKDIITCISNQSNSELLARNLIGLLYNKFFIVRDGVLYVNFFNTYRVVNQGLLISCMKDIINYLKHIEVDQEYVDNLIQRNHLI